MRLHKPQSYRRGTTGSCPVGNLRLEVVLRISDITSHLSSMMVITLASNRNARPAMPEKAFVQADSESFLHQAGAYPLQLSA